MERWVGRVAVVTGASAGIGAAIAKQLCQDGVKVVACARRVEKIEEIFGPGEPQRGKELLFPYKVDLEKDGEITEMFDWIENHPNLGRVDICVPNAGFSTNVSLLNGTAEEWRRMTDVNVIALNLCTQLAVKSMIKHKIDDGQIVMLNSMSGHRVPAGAASTRFYSATKFAVTALLEGWRQEIRSLGPNHIRVAQVSPGVVETEFSFAMNRDNPENAEKLYSSMKCIQANDLALSQPEVRAMANLKPEDRFDIVIVSVLFGNEAGYYLAHKMNASLVLYCTGMVSYSWMDYAVGQPHHSAYLPMAFSNFLTSMTFLERVANTFMTVALQAARDFYVLPKVDKLLDKHFPEDKNRPNLISLERNTSLAMGFGHPLLMDGWRPMAPNYISIGMMNCGPIKQFAKGDEIGDFLNGATDGAIYISFGSILQGSQMSDDRRKLFLNVFSRLKQRVIWKWETGEMNDVPSNVLLSKWLPQKEVLSHPNLKLFITHGGQSSFQESLCYQKPILVISIMADQFANGLEAVRLGFGLHLPFLELTEYILAVRIKDLIEKPEFVQNARTLGSALVDQVTAPLDRAVWWLEHILRHPGLYQGRSPVHKLAWYEYFLLDVLAFYFLITVFILYVICRLIRRCFCMKKAVEKVKDE